MINGWSSFLTPTLVLLLALLLLLPALSSAAPPLILTSQADTYHLDGTRLDVQEDPSGRLTIADVASPRYADAFTPANRAVPNYGMSDAVYWLRFTVENRSPESSHWVLLLAHPLSHEVALYSPGPDGSYHVSSSGVMRPQSDRTIQSRSIVLPLPVADAPRTLYLRADMRGWSHFPLTVMTRKAYQRLSEAEQFGYGGYAGLMIGMVLVGLMLLGFTGERTYLYFALYIFSNMLAQMGFKGYLSYWLFPAQPLLHDHLIKLLPVITFIGSLLFTRSFLRVERYAPNLDFCLKALIGLNMVLIPCAFAAPPVLFKSCLRFMFIINPLLGLIAAVRSWRRGYAPARYFFISRLVVYLGNMAFVLVMFSLLPVTGLTANLMVVTSVLDAAFISLALADRFRLLNRQVAALVTDLRHQVEERTAANLALQEEVAERVRLEREIVDISDKERRRISHELHDGLCQQLTGARLRFAALEDRLLASGIESTEVRPFAGLLDEAVNHAYDLSRGLWPRDPEPGHVALSLEELTRRLSEQSGIPIRLHQEWRCAACTTEHLPQLHHIAREALVNAVKHSRATAITVSLACDPEQGSVLEVSDNGVGRDTAPTAGGGLGTDIMNHRAALIGGRLRCEDVPGGGTRVICTAPCAHGDSHA